MKTPAEAALAPLGETKTTTGTSLAIMSLTMFLIEVSRPPGVSSSMIMASAFISFAFFMLLPMNSDATGFITPLNFTTST